VTPELVRSILGEELDQIATSLSPVRNGSRFDQAAQLFLRLVTAPEFIPFLTLPAYQQL
jgi:malate synthase